MLCGDEIPLKGEVILDITKSFLKQTSYKSKTCVNFPEEIMDRSLITCLKRCRKFCQGWKKPYRTKFRSGEENKKQCRNYIHCKF